MNPTNQPGKQYQKQGSNRSQILKQKFWEVLGLSQPFGELHSRTELVHILALLLASCVTKSELLNLSDPQIS